MRNINANKFNDFNLINTFGLFNWKIMKIRILVARETYKLKLTCRSRASNVNAHIRHAQPYRQTELIKQIYLFFQLIQLIYSCHKLKLS